MVRRCLVSALIVQHKIIGLCRGDGFLKMSLSRTHSKELLLKNWVFKLALMKQNFLGFMNISTATIFLGLVFQLIMSYTDMRLV
ncbi:not available [Escherichia coli]|nr:not available [Escherichia coli]